MNIPSQSVVRASYRGDTEEPALSKTWCWINWKMLEMKYFTELCQQNYPQCLLPHGFSEYLGKKGIFNWNLFRVLLNLTFPVQPTPFQIQKYTRIQAIARVIASGHRICPGFSNPSVIWCMLRLEEANRMVYLTTNSEDSIWIITSRPLHIRRNDTEKNYQLTPRIQPRHLSCWWCLLRCNWRSSGQCSMGSHSVSKEESI